MKVKTISILLFLFFMNALSQAQAKKSGSKQKPKLERFSYGTDNCDNVGYFNPNKYTSKQIKGAYALYIRDFSLQGPVAFTPASLVEIRNNFLQHSKDLDSQYQEAKLRFEKIQDIPNTKFWKDLKVNVGKNLEWSYHFEKKMLAAYRDVNTLKNSPYSAACSKYVEALTTKDRLKKLAVWKELAISSSKKNADPERIIQEFETNSKSKERNLYGDLELLNFGFSNCEYNNSTVKKVITVHDKADDQEFEKLFEKIKSDCEEH